MVGGGKFSKQIKVPWFLLTVTSSIGSGVVTVARSKAGLCLSSPLRGLMVVQTLKNPDGFFSSWSDVPSAIEGRLKPPFSSSGSIDRSENAAVRDQDHEL